MPPRRRAPPPEPAGAYAPDLFGADQPACSSTPTCFFMPVSVIWNRSASSVIEASRAPELLHHASAGGVRQGGERGVEAGRLNTRSMPDLRFAFGPYVYQPSTATLWRDKALVPHPAWRAAAVLQVLLEADNGVVTKAELMERAWPGVTVEEGNLAVQMAALRKGLGATSTAGMDRDRAAGRLSAGARPAATASPFDGRPSIAVLPFANLQQRSRAGLLRRWPGRGPDHRAQPVQDLCRRRPQFVLRLQGPRGRRSRGRQGARRPLRARGQRAAAGRAGPGHRPARRGEAGRISGPKISTALLEDIFDFQDRITEHVVGSIEPQIRKAEIERARRKRPESLDAYDLYLRALPLVYGSVMRGLFARRSICSTRHRARSRPCAGPALAAWAHEKRLSGGHVSARRRRCQGAIALAERALAADDSDAIVLVMARRADHAAQGRYRARICPDDAGARAQSEQQHRPRPRRLRLSFRGNYDDAIVCHLRALSLGPGPPEADVVRDRHRELSSLGRPVRGGPDLGAALAERPRSSTDVHDPCGGLCPARSRPGGEGGDANLAVHAAESRLHVSTDPVPSPADRFLADGLRKAGLRAA